MFTATGYPALLLNWIHSKITSAATFRIIGLTKIAKIELLPVDWIYHFIRIMTVGHYRISGKFLDLIKCLYRDTEYCVRVNDTVTEPFPVTSGVKQGCLLPCIIQSLHQ